MAFNWLYGIMLLLLLVQSSTEVEPTVPYSGAVRSTPKIPKWWTRGWLHIQDSSLTVPRPMWVTKILCFNFPLQNCLF